MTHCELRKSMSAKSFSDHVLESVTVLVSTLTLGSTVTQIAKKIPQANLTWTHTVTASNADV